MTRSAPFRRMFALPAAALAAATLATAAVPAFAHHSSAMFDATVEQPLEGTIREFKWTNPHAWLEIDVTAEDGSTVMWAVEMQPPNMLQRRGWTRRSLEAGDQVTVVVHPLHDGQPGGSFVNVTLADGTVLVD